MQGHRCDHNSLIKIQTSIMSREGVINTDRTLRIYVSKNCPGKDACLAFYKGTRMQVSFSLEVDTLVLLNSGMTLILEKPNHSVSFLKLSVNTRSALTP